MTITEMITMFPRHRLLFASMLLEAGTGSANPARSPAASNAENCQPLDQASQERWLAYMAETSKAVSDRR